MPKISILINNRLRDGGEVVSFTCRPSFPPLPKKFLVVISARDGINPKAIVRLEGLRKLKEM
jgi:hypothetical protein